MVTGYAAIAAHCGGTSARGYDTNVRSSPHHSGRRGAELAARARMQPRLASALLAAVVAGLAVATGAAHAAAVPARRAARIPCRPAPGTTTIAQSRRARVFSDDRNGNDYACLYSDGRARYLSSSEHYEYRLVRFAGAYVAFVVNVEASDDHVGVMNLRTGRLQSLQAVSPTAQTGLAQCPIATLPICYVVGLQVDALVLKATGAAAWIATNSATPTIEVRRHDRRGLRILDHGTAILPSSLRLSGSALHWTDAGTERTATLL